MLSKAAFLLTLLLLPVLLSCSSGDPNDLVFYKAPITLVAGRNHTRTLLLNGVGTALGVERDATGGLWVREGTIPLPEVQALLAELWSVRSVRKKAVGTDPSAGAWQIWARVDREEFSFRRYVDEPVAKAVAASRDRLEAVWSAIPVSEDPVGALEPFLASKISRIRGFAVNGLLSAWRDPACSEEERARAETILLGHQTVETNLEINRTLHQAMKKEQPKNELPR